MKFKKIITGSLLAIAVCAHAFTPSKIYIFGDSLSDAGYQNQLSDTFGVLHSIVPAIPTFPDGKLPTSTSFNPNYPSLLNPTPGYVYGDLLLNWYGIHPLETEANKQPVNNEFIPSNEVINPITKEPYQTVIEIPGTSTTLDVENIAVGSNFPIIGVTLTSTIYAAGGATTTGTGIIGVLPYEGKEYLYYNPPSVQEQIDQYLSNHNPETELNAVHIIWAGANNIFKHQLNPELLPEVAVEAAHDVKSQVSQLIDSGATRILVINLPDMGSTPAATFANQAIPGSAAGLTIVSEIFNLTLRTELNRIPNKQYVKIVDVFPLLREIIAEGSYTLPVNGTDTTFYFNIEYQPENSSVLIPACSIIGADWFLSYTAVVQALFCTPTEGTVGPESGWTSPEGANYLFADSVHPSYEGHTVIFNIVKNSIDEGWPTGDSGDEGWNSFWDFLLQIVSLGMAK